MKNQNHQLLNLLTLKGKICIDSRKAENGAIFFALKGDNFDGNRFAADALKAGCVKAVIDDPAFKKNDQYILVDDVLSFLQEMAKDYRKKLAVPFLGITGTNGKTTTKELCQLVLSRSFNSFATQGNLNNHIGVPVTILALKHPHDLAVIEMGANHVGEIAALSEIAMPTHGLITNIGKAHLEGFGSLDNIEKAKTELYRFVKKQEGTLFVNGDDERMIKYADYPNAVTYGKQPDFHCIGTITKHIPFLEISFETHKDFGALKGKTSGTIKTKLTGSYNFGNVMAAITIGLYFGVPLKDVIQAIEGYTPQNNRSQIVKTQKNTVLMDAYNANPTSMVAALENFQLIKNQPKSVFLGDMLELGEDAEKEHEQIVKWLNQHPSWVKVLVGNNFQSVTSGHNDVTTFLNATEAATWLKDQPVSGHHILIKGSRGIQMEQLLKYL